MDSRRNDGEKDQSIVARLVAGQAAKHTHKAALRAAATTG
jgi:hypothetical protein